MMKKCYSCKEIKLYTEFHKNHSKKDKLAHQCKKCVSMETKKRYPERKSYIVQKNKEITLRNQKFVYEYLLKNPCIDCGENDPVVLEFDHKHKKSNEISYMIGSNSIKTLLLEISKCVVRCANCHRRKTAKDYKYFRALQ